MHNNYYLESNGNLMENTFKKSSLSSELYKFKKKHMNLNSLIHIYSHKAKYNVEHITKKSFSPNIRTYQNTENKSSSGVFLTTNNNLDTISRPIQNLKKIRYVKVKNVKPFSENEFSRSINPSPDHKSVSVSNQFEIPLKRQKENTHMKIQLLIERERLKKAMKAIKLKESNKVLKENILIMKSKTM